MLKGKNALVTGSTRGTGLAVARALARDVLLAAQPTKQFVTVEQVSSPAVYLCSDGAAQITGANLVMDGGWTAA